MVGGISSVRDVQNRIRSVDMTFSPQVEAFGGKRQAFVYSLLTGFCEFASTTTCEANEEVREYAARVEEVLRDCFADIEHFGNQLDKEELKDLLQNKLNPLLFYPEKKDFEVLKDPAQIALLKAALKVGTYTLYKLPLDPQRYYGGRIDIPDASFNALVEILDQYKEPADMIGSAFFDRKGHVTTLEPGELKKDYEKNVEAHTTFVTEFSSEVSVEPIGIKIGNPQSGRMSKIVGVVVDIHGLDKYREAFGLGKMKFAPHISVFSQEISPISSLKGVELLEFTNVQNNPFLMRLHDCFERALAVK